MAFPNIWTRSWTVAQWGRETEMSGETNPVAAALGEVVKKHMKGASGITGLKRLSGGASQETWAFDATTD